MDEQRQPHSNPEEPREAPGGTDPAQTGTTEAEATASDVGSPPTINEEDGVLEELEKERARAAEYLEEAQRARAEFINYRRRVQQEMEEIRERAAERLIRRLLPVLDDFHRAIDAVPAEERDNPWLQGMLLIERKFWSTLEDEGVRPIEAVGKPFDPALHEAVLADENASTHDTVIEELQRGYMLHNHVLRPSAVKVGEASTDGRTPDGTEEADGE